MTPHNPMTAHVLAGVTVMPRAEENVFVLEGAQREVAVGHMPLT